MTDGLLQSIVGAVPGGIFLVLALLALRQRDRELQEEKEARRLDGERFRAELAAEKNARIEDARLSAATSLALQKEAIIAVTTLAKATERVEEEAEQRERLERELHLRGGIPTPMGGIPVQQQLPPGKGRPTR